MEPGIMEPTHRFGKRPMARHLKMENATCTGSVDKDKEVMSQSKGNTSIKLIKEKMKEKRRKKALNDNSTSWSRSFSKRKGTSASLILKASLRSNNQSLAKALAASKHNAQQAHQNNLELQREKQLLLQQANSKKMAEKECIQRFGDIKQVLSKVTHSLLDAVSSLGLAIDLCSCVPLRKSSLGIGPRTSMTSDDESFGTAQKADQRSATYGLSSAIECAASRVLQAVDTMATATIDQSDHSVPQSGNEQAHGTTTSKGVFLSDKDLANQELDMEFPSLEDLDIPLRFTDDSKVFGSSNPRRQSCRLEPPVKRCRNTILLDPIAIQKALAKDASGSPEGSPKSPEAPDQQTAGEVKKRYVFVHTPPGNVSNYKTIDMELTGVTNNTTSTQAEQNKSLIKKSFYNHDEQVIRPWGNINIDKPNNSQVPEVTKPKNKTKPPTTVSKSLLPKPQKKSLKGSAMKAKGNKKASSKILNKMTSLLSESMRNDLAVFDLSAGDSFSLAPPIFQSVKSKTTDVLAASTEKVTNQDAGIDFDNEKSTEDPIILRCPEPMPQEEQLQPIQQEELLDPIHQEEHSQAELLKPVESVTTNRGGKIKRKSKKAKSVVSPGIGKMTDVQKTKPSVAILGCDNEANDIFGNAQETPTWQSAEDISDAVQDLVSTKPTKRRSAQNKQVEVKALNTTKTTSIVPKHNTEQSVQHPHRILSTNKAELSVTFDPSNPTQLTNQDCDVVPHRKKKSVSTAITTPTSEMDTQINSQPARAAKSNSRTPVSTKLATNKVSASSSRRGQKRKADILKEGPAVNMKEEETLEIGRSRRRAKQVSYKEPSLRDKMRRERSPHLEKNVNATKKQVKRNKRTALETVTNME